MSFKRRMVHLSMVSDGFDAVVHDALLSSMVRGGDGRGGVCDDPFLHPHTLVGHHDYDQNQSLTPGTSDAGLIITSHQ